MTAIVRHPIGHQLYQESIVKGRSYLLRNASEVERFWILRPMVGTAMEKQGHPYVLRAYLLGGRIFEEGWPDAGLALTWCKRRIFNNKPMNYLGIETRCGV